MPNVRIDRSCGHIEVVWLDSNHPVYKGRDGLSGWLKGETDRICYERCGGPKTTSNGKVPRKMAKTEGAVADREGTEQDTNGTGRVKRNPDEIKASKKDYAVGYWDGYRGRESKGDYAENDAYTKGFATGTRKASLEKQGEAASE